MKSKRDIVVDILSTGKNLEDIVDSICSLIADECLKEYKQGYYDADGCTCDQCIKEQLGI